MSDPRAEITVVVHPYADGWRWAVMAGGGSPADLERCAGAGWCPEEPDASLRGEEAGSTAVKAARMLGVPARYGYLRLGYDPLPADADQHPIGVWRGEDVGQQVVGALRSFVENRGGEDDTTEAGAG